MRTRTLLSVCALALAACNESGFKGAAVKPIAIASGVASGPASPLFEFDLYGGDSYDPNALEPNGIYEYEWAVYSTPPNAVTTIDPGGEYSEFTTDQPGRHVIELRVRDINDFAWSDPTYFVIRAFPVTGFAVTLTWTTDVNDVDLHLIEETQGGDLFDQETDCHFANLAPDWPPMGSADGDPRLNHDYVDGHGPETVELPVPTIGERYHVIIHYFSDDGFADTDATVKIWVNGNEEAELERNLVANQLWDVGVLDWTGASGQFGMVDAISTY